MEYTKKDDHTLRVIKQVQVDEENDYNIDFLKSQEKRILSDIDKCNEELEEVRTLIKEAEKLGITEKTTEDAG